MAITEEKNLIKGIIPKLVLQLQTETDKDSEIIKMLGEVKLYSVSPISFFQYFEVQKGKLEMLTILDPYTGIFNVEKDGKRAKFLKSEDWIDITTSLLDMGTRFSIHEKTLIERLTKKLKNITENKCQEIFEPLIDIRLPYTFYIRLNLVDGLLTIEGPIGNPQIIFR